jgi:hypothetical protein
MEAERLPIIPLKISKKQIRRRIPKAKVLSQETDQPEAGSAAANRRFPEVFYCSTLPVGRSFRAAMIKAEYY